jgi:hypothetical protein
MKVVQMGADQGTARHGRWQALDDAAFGLVYGSITVLSLLLAFDAHPESPLRVAVILLGSVTAILLSKAFAGVMAEAIQGRRKPGREDFRQAWLHGQAALVAANLPALLFGLSALGVLGAGLAMALAEGFCILMLMLVGARVGWVAEHRVASAVAGAAFVGGLGIALGLLKLMLH